MTRIVLEEPSGETITSIRTAHDAHFASQLWVNRYHLGYNFALGLRLLLRGRGLPTCDGKKPAEAYRDDKELRET